MKSPSIYPLIQSKSARQEKQFAVLIDPDKVSASSLKQIVQRSEEACADYFFVGGSLMNGGQLERTIVMIKELSEIPVVLFPGSPLQVSNQADAILFLSLISGRNAELLIGHHVIASPYIKSAGLEVLSTGYLLVDSGQPTTASYMSNTSPIPYNKPEIAACTALAGEYLGMKLIYLDGGSGAKRPLSAEMIKEVKQITSIPLIVGGGIDNQDKALLAYRAGADVVVVGNAIETNPERIADIAAARATFTTNLISP